MDAENKRAAAREGALPALVPILGRTDAPDALLAVACSALKARRGKETEKEGKGQREKEGQGQRERKGKERRRQREMRREGAMLAAACFELPRPNHRCHAHPTTQRDAVHGVSMYQDNAMLYI